MTDYREWNRRLVAALNIADGTYYRWARRSGITWHTLSLLYALDDGQPHSQKQICEEWLIPKTTINTVVKTCQEAGYITLQAMPDQPRQRQICLTEAGRAHARQVLESLYQVEDRAMEATLRRFPESFVPAMAYYAAQMKAAFEEYSIENEVDASHENPTV